MSLQLPLSLGIPSLPFPLTIMRGLILVFLELPMLCFHFENYIYIILSIGQGLVT